MSVDDGVIEVLNRNHQLLSNKKVLICGNINSLKIITQLKDLKRCFLISDNFDIAKSLATMVGAKIDNNTFCKVDKKHLSLICGSIHDQRVIEAIDEDIDLFILLLNKVKSLNQSYLYQLRSLINHNCHILLLGANELGGKSADSLIKDFAQVGKIDSARKCTLFMGGLKEDKTNQDIKAPHNIADINYGGLSFKQNNGIFSQGKLDKGSELLLDAIHHDLELNHHQQFNSLKNTSLQERENLKHINNVLDLGCGCGIIALSLAYRGANNIVASDISQIALNTSYENALNLNLQDKVKFLACNMLPSDDDLKAISYNQNKFDYIITNPPFHDASKRTLIASQNMIKQAPHSLNKNGVLYLVGNTCLHYEEQLNSAFNTVNILIKTPKFTVFKAYNA